jgi:hypothetical protein
LAAATGDIPAPAIEKVKTADTAALAKDIEVAPFSRFTALSITPTA